MTDSIKATRATVTLGTLTIDGFLTLPGLKTRGFSPNLAIRSSWVLSRHLYTLKPATLQYRRCAYFFVSVARRSLSPSSGLPARSLWYAPHPAILSPFSSVTHTVPGYPLRGVAPSRIDSTRRWLFLLVLATQLYQVRRLKPLESFFRPGLKTRGYQTYHTPLMLPDGSYRMSQTQAAACIEDDAVYARNFLTSRVLKALRGEGYTPETFEVSPDGQTRGQTRIQGWPLDIVFAYWVYRCHKGSKPAFNLVVALGTETLERRFDRAFGVTRSEDDWDIRLSERTIAQLEINLGTAFAETDTAINRERLLEQQIRSLGVESWALPQDETDQL